jgi:predicted short-subunit dehydrogenase-like oxidoreductase (DUF2520 family)
LISRISSYKEYKRGAKAMTSDATRAVFRVPFATDMLQTMKEGKRSPRIAIVGTGKLGSALALSLRTAGYSISEIVSRDREDSRRRAKALARQVGSSTATFQKAALRADLVWFCVPDGEIAKSARSLAAKDWKGKIAVHSSGALTGAELTVLRERGAHVASAHPMMTFVGAGIPALRGVGFAIEGDPLAMQLINRIVRRLDGESFPIDRKDKPLYHAWGMFASPLLTALLATTEQVARRTGIARPEAHRRMIPILRQTLANYASFGASNAFSGPIVRGDTETVKRHLHALESAPVARKVYAALAQAAIHYLPTKNKVGLRRMIERALRR